MALLHYMQHNCARYKISLSALNCDHGMRGKDSERDSEFVKKYCSDAGIPLLFFKADGDLSTESDARIWRVFRCYAVAHCASADWEGEDGFNSLGTKPVAYTEDGAWQGCDAVATAHHMDDNAETVLFNLARGSALSGMCGIQDDKISDKCSCVHPFVGVSRSEIDGYVAENGIEYVDDCTNFSDDYTRNFIRHNVIPALEKAVPGAVKAIYRFSRLAAEDEEYLTRQAEKLISCRHYYGESIAYCPERALFKRAAIDIIEGYRLKDYTSQHADGLYELQFAQNGKKFCFLGLTAVKEEGYVTIYPDAQFACTGKCRPFSPVLRAWGEDFGGQILIVAPIDLLNSELESISERLKRTGKDLPLKVLKFDGDAVPSGSEVRTMRAGDKFTKFGGGTKNLGDFFTDKKISRVLRPVVPVIACGNKILLAGGVEISDDLKVTSATKNILCAIAFDYAKL